MINQEEYEILKSLDSRMKWISRDKNRKNFTFEEKPYKRGEEWVMESIWTGFCVTGYDYVAGVNLFQFIHWEDEGPHNIAELIEEYEVNQAYEKFNRQFERLYEEIEGAEVKIDRMDEPKELVVPKFVADWWGESDHIYLYGGMRCRKEAKFDLISLFHDRGLEDHLWKVEDWIENNKGDFIDLVNGRSYKVEEDPKYYVKLIEGAYLEYYPKSGNFGITGHKEGNHGLVKLTEDRIKSLPKGDILFEHFAMPAEEVEE